MKVSELIDILWEYDQEKEVYVSADPEGNSFRGVWVVQEEWFMTDEREVYADEDAPDYPELDKAIVIWPG